MIQPPDGAARAVNKCWSGAARAVVAKRSRGSVSRAWDCVHRAVLFDRGSHAAWERVELSQEFMDGDY